MQLNWVSISFLIAYYSNFTIQESRVSHAKKKKKLSFFILPFEFIVLMDLILFFIHFRISESREIANSISKVVYEMNNTEKFHVTCNLSKKKFKWQSTCWQICLNEILFLSIFHSKMEESVKTLGRQNT